MACPENPSCEDLIEFLNREDPEHEALCFSWNDNLHRWSMDEIAAVSQALLKNYVLTNLPINLTSVVNPSLTASVLVCFQRINLFQLDCPFTRRGDDVSPDVVDALLRGLATSKSEVRHFETTRSGGNAAIIDFCSRFSDTLVSFSLGIGYRMCNLTETFELAVSLALDKLTSLRKINMFCCNHGLSRIVTSLVASPLLEKAELTVFDDQLEEVARLCTYSRSLKEVTIESYEETKLETENGNENESEVKATAHSFLAQTRFSHLRSLTMTNFVFQAFDLIPQTTLLSLTLVECDLEPGSLVVLQSFPNLTSLKLSACVYPEGVDEKSLPDHSICVLLRNLPSLRMFESTYYLELASNRAVSALCVTNSNSLVSGIAIAGSLHPSLRSITLKLYGEMTTENRQALYFPALPSLMKQVERLTLYCTEFAWVNIYHIVRGLEESNSPKHESIDPSKSSMSRLRHLTLHFEDCRVDNDYYSLIFRTVAKAQLLSFCIDFDNCDRLISEENNGDSDEARELSVQGNDRWVGKSLVHLLQSTKNLETLELYYVNPSLFHELVSFLIAGLAKNSTLSRLVMQQNAIGSVFMSEESTSELLELLNNGKNTSLATLLPTSILPDDPSETKNRIQYFLRLNGYGRRFLNSPSLTASMWPLILERIALNNDAIAMFHFLRMMPSLVRTGKRIHRRDRPRNMSEVDNVVL